MADPPVDTPGSATAAIRRPRPSSGRGIVFAIVILVLLGVGAPFGWRYLAFVRTHESTDDAFIDADVIQVSSHVPGTIQRVLVTDNQEVKAGDLLAEIDPRDYVAQVTQKRAALLAAKRRAQSAKENVKLTSTTTTATVETAQSTVDMALSGVAQANDAANTARTNVLAAQGRQRQADAAVAAALRTYQQMAAQVPASQAEVQRSSADLQRYRKLYGQDEVSRQQLDQALATWREAVSALNASKRRAEAAREQVVEARAAQQTAVDGVRQAQSEVAEAESHVRELEAQVQQARGQLASANSAPQQVQVKRTDARTAGADVKQTQADLVAAELNLSYTHIVAPAAGRITKKAMEVGMYVQPGQTLTAIVPYNVYVVADFKETQITDMKKGDEVEITVDAFPNRVYRGRVDSIQSGTGSRFSMLPPENATGNHVKVVQRVPVKIVFDDPPEKLRELGPGMSVEPTVRVR